MSQLEDEEQPEPAEFIRKRNAVDFVLSARMLFAVDRQHAGSADGDGDRKDAASILESMGKASQMRKYYQIALQETSVVMVDFMSDIEKCKL